MKQKIEELKKRFVNAGSDKEMEDIDKEMDLLSKESPSEFVDALFASIKR
jgi:hypothetical protein